METPVPPPATDFPDWLSPMLVKELRQGVRSRVFVTLFILLQVAMLVTLSLTLLVASDDRDTSAGSFFFWLIVGVPILLVLPLSGLGAVNNEIKANTLELIFLTRLTAFRIVAGKWFAVFVQALLFVCAVLPYLVLRYFIGGINLAGELITLAVMLATSALLAGAATGLSAYPTRVVRVAAVLSFVLFLGFAADPFFARFGSGPVLLGGGTGWREIIGYCLCGLIFLLLMLEVGAAKIAPPAENHSAILRLLALAALGVAAAVGWAGGHSLLVTFTALAMATFVCAVSLCEEARWIPSLFRPWAARGWAGRAAGRFLYPGWYTGVPFTTVVFTAFGALLVRQKIVRTDEHFVAFIALAGTLLFPVALIRTFLPRTRRALVLFFAVQIFGAVATVFCLVCDQILRSSFKDLCAFLPLSMLILSGSQPSAWVGGQLVVASATTGASLLLLLVAMLRPMRLAHVAETASLQRSTPPALSTAPDIHDAPLA